MSMSADTNDSCHASVMMLVFGCAGIKSGPSCIDNQWNVTITSNSIAATDTTNRATFTASRF